MYKLFFPKSCLEERVEGATVNEADNGRGCVCEDDGDGGFGDADCGDSGFYGGDGVEIAIGLREQQLTKLTMVEDVFVKMMVMVVLVMQIVATGGCDGVFVWTKEEEERNGIILDL
nr:hypothetical protein [Tanacetum cinerariifolium]